MPLHVELDSNKGVSQNVTNLNVGAGATNSTNTANTSNARNSILFGNPNIHMLSENTGADLCTKIAEHIKDLYAELIPNANFNVSILNKNVAILGPAYSAVVVSTKNNKEVTYFTIIVPSSGREARTAGQMATELLNLQNRAYPGAQPQLDIFTYDQCVDGLYDKSIKHLLSSVYTDVTEDNMYSLDGVVLPYHIRPDDLLTISHNAGILANRALVIDSELATGSTEDLNLKRALDDAGQSLLKTSKAFSRTCVKNQFGEPVRADWSLILEQQDNNRKTLSLNNNNNIFTLTQVSGYVDAIPEEIQVPTAPGYPATSNVRLHPHIVITGTSVRVPTPAYLLLSILSSLPMVNSSMWSAPLIANIDNVRHLNKITNIENNPDGVGASLELNKKATEADIKHFIGQMFTLDPILSVDIQSFGPQTFFTSLLSNAASPENTQSKYNSLKMIVETAHHLTNGMFPLTYDLNKIFMSHGVNVPTGVWANNKGEHDIREIDLAFIAANTTDNASLFNWAISNLAGSNGLGDPFAMKTIEIGKLIPDAVINGRVFRVTFTGEFLNTLAEAAKACGFNFTYEPEVMFDAARNNWGSFGSILASGGINPLTANGLAREYIGATPAQYYNPYANMGSYGRYHN